ncbi:MAG TPA: glycoside hydrolase family 18 protein [Bacteroidota bacterium]|nr:glycoside hydrolase family 18 protein [Bacteroidota bacterium]
MNSLRVRWCAAVLPLLALSFLSGSAQPRKDVVGYYPSWKWRPGAHGLAPADIPFDRLTVINYAFFAPRPDGTIAGRDTAGDARILLPEASPRGSARSTSLVALAHRHGVRVLLSIGGWEDSGEFPRVASDAGRRGTFARSCASAITRYGFDGIDIDWEFPGLEEHNGTAADSGTFPLLLETLRDTLNRLGSSLGRHLVLSAALPALDVRAGVMSIRRVAPLLDFLNIMTYDLYGTWEPMAYHNAPLYAGPGGDSARTVDGAFRLYHGKYGVPARKINLGVPFYGHTFTDCNELLGAHSGADTVLFSPAGAVYAVIAGHMGEFTRHWDPYAMVPYLTSPVRRTLVSYDDPGSVRLKAEYVAAHGARGLIIWEITDDALPDGSHPLLEAIDRVFRPLH